VPTWPAAGIALGLTLVAVVLYRVTRAHLRARVRRAARRAIRRFDVRLNRYKLVDRLAVRDVLLADGAVQKAVRRHAREHGIAEEEVTRSVHAYIEEIVPSFSVLSYYRLGYNVSRVLLHLLYRVRSDYQDRDALNAIPRDDVVVYTMNHRSNADYVVVAYLLANRVSISYAVGEWARVWPLEYIFKSFGSYFVRRRFREPLYHTVLERYVQLITRNGVTQGIFLEGGLTRTGRLQTPKLGLLDYLTRTAADPDFTKNIWLIPVAINYDRVLEDRSLIAEQRGASRPARVRQLASLGHFLFNNFLRLISGNLKRYGRVAVNFGTPVSLGDWLKANPGTLDSPPEDRLPRLKSLADEIMRRIEDIMPVTAVPLVCAALLSFGETAVSESNLLDRVDEYLDAVRTRFHPHVRTELGPRDVLERAWLTFHMRQLVVKEGRTFVIIPRQRPLLEYYANSVIHLLPAHGERRPMHPAGDADVHLPHLSDPPATIS
jgi:glycerol-3-phosphate O-acyltransferase